MDDGLEAARLQLRASFSGVNDRLSTRWIFDYDSWRAEPRYRPLCWLSWAAASGPASASSRPGIISLCQWAVG